MKDNDEVPNSDRSPRAARVAAAVMLLYVMASVAGA